MKLIANMVARNASWVLGLSARVAIRWCDSLVLMLHACTDRSAEIAAEIETENPGRLKVLVESNPLWNEMAYRQRMLECSRAMGATHIAIVDADEVLTGNLVAHAHEMVRTAPPHRILACPIYNLRGSIHQYHANGIWGNRRTAIAFEDAPHFGWHGDGFHHREPMGEYLETFQLVPHGFGGVMHLWGASERRLKAHHAHYKLTERQRWPEKPISDIDSVYSWSIHGRNGDAKIWTFDSVPAEWWEPYSDLMQHLGVDSDPWEERACREIVACNPGINRGLDLFGVCLGVTI